MRFFLLASGLTLGLLFALAPRDARTFSGGAGTGYTGNFADEGVPRTCAVCHSSFDLNSGSGGVAIEAPETFAPGEPVEVVVTLTNETEPTAGGEVRNGFAASVRGPGGQVVGTLDLVEPTRTRFTSALNEEVTHSAGGLAPGESSASWRFRWTPPAEGAPSAVTVYASGNAANGDGGTAGDHVYATTRALAQAAVSAEGAGEGGASRLGAAYPNPTRGSAQATLTLAAPSEVLVRLVDGRGRALRTLARGPHPAGPLVLDLGAEGLAPGTYFLVAETGGQRHTQPLVVVR